MQSCFRIAGAAALATLPAAACSDSAGLGDPAPVTVMLQQATTPTPAPAMRSAGPGAAAAIITLADVESLNVRVTRIEALPLVSVDDSASGGGWQSLNVVGSGLLNLVKLPTEVQAGLTVASDSIPAGEYVDLRAFLTEMTIWLNKQVIFGQITFQPHTPYTLTMPSGGQAGLKTNAHFTVPDDGGQVLIVFDGTATLANLAVTGTGTVMVAPVLRQK